MSWNGLDLASDFAKELGDTTPAFKTKVLRWINEGVREIATAHNWSFLREKGKVALVSGTDTQSIVLAKPGAATVALATGGALVDTSIYKVLVTFYEGASGVESIAGEESAPITSATPDLSITLSDIPVSTNPLVTARKVYISKNGSSFIYQGMISNNLEELPGTPDPLIDPPTPVTYTIAADSASSILPPDENMIHMIDGDFFIEGERVLKGSTVQDIIFRSNASSSSGTPSAWAPVNHEEILVYPKPSSANVLSFYYFKLPARIFGAATSVPQIPSWLYPNLRDYVIYRGFDYRDRAGKESKKLNYDEGLRLAISRKGKPLKRSERIRSVTPDSDGYGV